MIIKPPIEIINQNIDHWLQEEFRAQKRLEFCHHQLDSLIGAKTLRLIQGDLDDSRII